MTCCRPDGIEQQFDRANASKELRRLRRRGPPKHTRRLLAMLGQRAARASLLDIGGGVGTIHHLLLDAGARDAIHVDISNDYLAVAREEAFRRGHGAQVRFVHGDFVDVAADLPAADLVSLDRVVCCYPDMRALLGRAAEKTQRLLGAVYPRDAWWVRMMVRSANLFFRIKRSPFRLYLHSPSSIDAVLRAGGLAAAGLSRTGFWEIAVYERSTAQP